MTWTQRRWNDIKRAEKTEKHTGRRGRVEDEDKCDRVVGGNMSEGESAVSSSNKPIHYEI